MHYLNKMDGNFKVGDYVTGRFSKCAEVAELADALDSKSCVLTGVWVQIPPSVPCFPGMRTHVWVEK